MYPVLYEGELLLKSSESPDQKAHRKHGVDHQGQFGFKAAGDAARLNAETVHFLHDGPHSRQKRSAAFGQDGAIRRPVEQIDADLLLQLLNRIGDSRLGAVQLPGRCRETSLLNYGHQDPELIEGERIHVHQFI
ncbi:MAG: hypothetical protein JWN11_959 [Hyphomicrobiales bacterium]|nr:hypothetical protein [Hyphomicrobiales bacterium]